jgi:uncharacterized membrane-anchored protein
MATPETRGSEKVLEQLFGEKAVTTQQLAAAVEHVTAAGLKLERWWWKGQPHPDWFRAVVRVRPNDLTTAVTQLINFHSETNQLSLELFPKGVPKLEAVDMHITVDRNIRG